MKQLIENLIKKSIETINPDNSVNVDNIRIDRTKDRAHGDFATNIAMLLAKFHTILNQIFWLIIEIGSCIT